ncbi:MAG: hypothetical protein RIC55_19920 [Pirellulaceae bacterium]
MSAATDREALIEQIVQEVLRRLQAMGVKLDAEAPQSNIAGQELVFDGRLVTLDRLRGRLTGVRRLVVSKRAVVTPAVRDELKDRQIELVKAET